jgi:PII-like signaling protein
LTFARPPYSIAKAGGLKWQAAPVRTPLWRAQIAHRPAWSADMTAPIEAVLLRIFVSGADRFHGRPLYESIVMKALEQKMAGATVLRGPKGFGHAGRIRSELNVDAGPRTPMVVEIVDSHEKIGQFLPLVDEMIETGLVTLELVRAIAYRSDRKRSRGRS